MFKFKRAGCVLVAVAMTAGMLAGCGGDPVPDADAEAGMEQGAELDLGSGDGVVGGSEETNQSLDDLVDAQGNELEDAGGYHDDAVSDDGSDAVDSDAVPDDSLAGLVVDGEEIIGNENEVRYVAPLMPDEIAEREPAGTSELSVNETVAPVVEPVAMPLEASAVIEDEMVAMAASTYQTYLPVASTTNVRNTNMYGWIDYGNAKDGYVVVCYTASTSARLKCLVKGPSGTQYTYNLTQGAVTTLPLSDGSGTYSVGLYENVTGSKYAKNLSQDFSVSLANEFGPFLYSNQYVDYMSAPNTRATGEDLCGRAPDLLGKVDQVYSWVVTNIKYDYNKAATVQSGYLPVLDTVLANRTGICFDYAALMAGMLRSQGIPCKLVVGYAGTAYHAWISVWSEEQGWIEGVIYFDGSSWQRMDPTFASSGGQSDSIMQYIGNGANYQEKYLY